MQEQQHVADGVRRARIHLQRAPGRRGQHPVGQRRGGGDRAVAAAAVGENQLDAALAQPLQRAEKRQDARRFVQRRNDNRKGR
jgi:hypothetical protein